MANILYDLIDDEAEFALAFYRFYECDCGRVSLKCLKCSVVIGYAKCESHIAICYIGKDSSIFSKGNVATHTKKHICLFSMTRYLPQSMSVNIDYNSQEITEITGNTVSTYIDSENEIFGDIISAIMKQDVCCAICGCYFDNFPTMEIMRAHLTNCNVRVYT